MTPDEAIDELTLTPRLLVALDFDGTLSPLVDEPMSARMTPDARAAVDALVAAPGTTVALVSGRTLHDLRVIAEYEDRSPILLAGSHGAEQWPPADEVGAHGDTDADASEAPLALRDDLRARAEAVVAGEDGAWIEPKEFGFALHTRLMDASGAARVHAAIDQLVDDRAPDWRRRSGHNLLEFSFRHEGKDGAVDALRARTHATAVLFAGDDVTDGRTALARGGRCRCAGGSGGDRGICACRWHPTTRRHACTARARARPSAGIDFENV
jgi:trehalose 6-phosphate phosphatase